MLQWQRHTGWALPSGSSLSGNPRGTAGTSPVPGFHVPATAARLSRNALDQYNIYGARGFKAAFKRMLSEQMEVYLEQGAKNIQDKPWWKQAVDHVKQIDAIAARLLECKPLLESVGALLLGRGG